MLEFSTEFFPLTTPGPLKRLSDTWLSLRSAGVNGYSLTFGALGAAKDKSTDCLKYLRTVDRKTRPVMHLTCRGQTWKGLDRRLAQWQRLGVERVLALRGDAFRPRNDGPNNTVELVEFLNERGLRTSVAAYPDGHPDAADFDTAREQDWLLQKLNAGADQVVTQFTPNTDGILRLHADLQAYDPAVTLKAGVMPIADWQRYQTLSARCGIAPEAGETLLFDALPEDSHNALALGLAYANMRTLRAAGVRHFHLYGLNSDRLLLPLIQSLRALDGAEAEAIFTNPTHH